MRIIKAESTHIHPVLAHIGILKIDDKVMLRHSHFPKIIKNVSTRMIRALVWSYLSVIENKITKTFQDSLCNYNVIV